MLIKIPPRVVSCFVMIGLLTSCKLALKVGEIKTAKTDLEEQVLGSWYKIDDDLILVSTVRGDDSGLKSQKSPLELAKLNRLFNQDDVDELKEKQILGERFDGRLEFVPSKVSGVKATEDSSLRLAEIILKEENANRETIWRETYKNSGSGQSEDIDQYRKAWAEGHRKHFKPGHWFLDHNQKWVRHDVSD